ncbi:hypothetical protein O181_016739 [Austropuccinia psidii MF-1]|uniref:Uncharacterized protein n=1 Tax=Austropuccinia psidii MF-1 TaxID=1389203 RepID=A0A9Q3GS39_9BASI|nr:hypothetical protein [Austropuccinia psidii MF-1]
MPVQHSPPARQTRSPSRAQAVLTPMPRAPLDGTPAVPQLRAHLERGPNLEGTAPSRKEGRGPRRSSIFSGVFGRLPGLSKTTFKGPGENGEEEESDGTEGVPAPVGESQGTLGPTLVQSNQSEPSILAILRQMNQIMADIQADYSSEASRPPAFQNTSMKAPGFLDGTPPFKVRSFIQSYHFIVHNDLENFSKDRNKFLYATSFPIGMAAKCIEPYLSNLTNQAPNYPLKKVDMLCHTLLISKVWFQELEIGAKETSSMIS